ncbi:TetR/AcrR family transcriptional regulator [Ottowia testudinis]|uniref:TetR/AcrR family transcriptional regulator n=1 Tax=Ottowia testudinis TaxID=2816950 RepID=A0A975H498_9BURK|nr:TetR/AcrR family transcriptional regulator [Ottowia testudinis]QTD46140.1 TetR/AcrR family transcriptional regulator [Ottowia testudinis]
MSGNVRQRMIEGATEVLARRGLHATAFSEVLSLTGASRGSIYHHFPGGKAELMEAVLDDVGTRCDDALRALRGRPVAAVVDAALELWRAKLVRNDCESGCPVAALTIAADSGRMLDGCRETFNQWRDTLASALQTAGCEAQRAIDFATLLLACVQGAIVLSRAEGQPTPFDSVARQLRAQAAGLV